MQSATIGVAQSHVARSSDADGAPQLVAVRSAVVDTIGHVLGNLFQRIYHLTDQVQTADADTAAQLHASVQRLEAFLQLAMDYFAPPPLGLQQVSAADIAQSLARQISEATSRPLTLDTGGPLDERALVDPAQLARSFALLASIFDAQAAGRGAVRLQAFARVPSGSLVLLLTVPAELVPSRSSEFEMRWAVAEKVMEIHGGLLHETPTTSGELLWEIVLPLQC